MILLVAATGIGIAAAVTLWLGKPVYRASMKIVVGQGGGLIQPQDSAAVQPLTQTMTSLLKSDIVARIVISSLGLEITPQRLLNTLQVTSNPESSVLELSYDSADKRQALSILQSVGGVFTSLTKQKLASKPQPTASGVLTPPVTATVFDPAHLDPGQVSPQPTRSMAIAGALGLAIGLILAFVRETLDDRLRGRRDAERWFAAPVIGTLPKGSLGTRPIARQPALDASAKKRDEAWDSISLTPTVKPPPLSPRFVEAISFLRANLEFARGGTRGPVLSVTSATRNESKGAVAAALGIALAAGGYSVICVDTDVRSTGRRNAVRHGVGDVLVGRGRDGETLRYGLSDILLEGHSIDAALVDLELAVPSLPFAPKKRRWRATKGGAPDTGVGTTQPTQLQLLLAGRTPRRVAQMFTRERVTWLLEQLRDRADFVIFDTAPLLGAGDAFPLLHSSDNVVVVARAGTTKRATAEAARAMLEGLGLPSISVVVTDASFRDSHGGEQPPRFAEAMKSYFTT